MALQGRYRAELEAELAILAETGDTRVIAADSASLAAIAPNPLDPSRLPAAPIALAKRRARPRPPP
jgi:hypothetical protein